VRGRDGEVENAENRSRSKRETEQRGKSEHRVVLEHRAAMWVLVIMGENRLREGVSETVWQLEEESETTVKWGGECNDAAFAFGCLMMMMMMAIGVPFFRVAGKGKGRVRGKKRSLAPPRSLSAWLPLVRGAMGWRKGVRVGGRIHTKEHRRCRRTTPSCVRIGTTGGLTTTTTILMMMML
jgi:hypothetical protein